MRLRHGSKIGDVVAAEGRRASVEQSAERIEGIARMAPAPQLMDAPVQNPPLETLPTRLARCVGLIGLQQKTSLACSKRDQQGVGRSGGLGGHEHRADQRKRTDRRPAVSLAQVDFEFAHATAAADDRRMGDPAANCIVRDEIQRVAF
ncbi:MAG TPA: hypothetical protein VN662_10190, partial [Rhodanobacteraceae bacterium]|nr:hypothetical protein [Rhodanobacteraceae bacterium]